MSRYNITDQQTNDMYNTVSVGWDAPMQDFFCNGYLMERPTVQNNDCDEPQVQHLVKVAGNPQWDLNNIEDLRIAQAMAMEGVYRLRLECAGDGITMTEATSNQLIEDFLAQPTFQRSAAMQGFLDNFFKGDQL